MSAVNDAILLEVADALTEVEAHGDKLGTAVLKESFDRIRGILARDDRGWVRLYGDAGHREIFGLTLQDLKDWGRKIEESVPGAPWMGRGFRLRANNIHKDGIQHGNIPQARQGTSGLQHLIDDVHNQREYFGPEARKRKELNLYSRGIALYLGNQSTKRIEALPLRQIVDVLTDPNELGQAWAYLREWNQRDLKTGKIEPVKMWYFTDQHLEHRKGVRNIQNPSTREIVPVSQSEVILDQHANRADGLVFGTPDALAAHIWNGIARDAYMDGISMQEALTRFALHAKSGSRDGARNAAVQYATSDEAGAMVVTGDATDVSVLASAGKGYDFSSIGPIVAMVATSLDVSKVALMADAADEGGYASTVTLDLPTRLAMESRREEHVEFEKRVLKFLGMTDTPDVFYHPFNAGEEVYRALQAYSLAYDRGLYTPQQARDFVDHLLGFAKGKVPESAQKYIDNLLEPKQSSNDGATTQTASPNQGRSNGTGGQRGGNASNDLRSDTVS